MGCSPEFHSVNIQAHHVVLAGGATDGLTWGWSDFFNEPWRHMRITISHEMVHIMCQIAIINDASIPLHPKWLLEGIANYFAEMEQIRFVPSGWGKTIQEAEVGMLMSLPQQNLCDFPLNKAEFDTDSGQLINRMPDYPGVGQAATIYLAKTSLNGIKSLIDFYAYLSEHSEDDAFQMAFGRTKTEFYAEFREKCDTGFLDLAFTPTPLPEGAAEIRGTVTLENGKQNFSDYVITFCISKCPVNTYVQPDGSFSIIIPPGPYKISISSAVDGTFVGWYSKQGLVNIKDCADGINVHPDENLNITISIGTPIFCP